MRAESPGYDVGKMTPRLRQSAMTLYVIYLVLTVIQVVFLLCGGMPLFDSLCIAFGTAGTGGFSITNNGLAAYSPYCQSVCTVFMLLFGVNFSLYYLILCRQFRLVARDEELWTYLGLFLGATVLITLNIMPMMKSGIAAFHHAAFQVSSIMTTTGFNTVDFDVWPSFSKAILILLMFIGASAGSTGGGLKVSRLLIGLKTLKREANKILHPRNVRVIRMSGHSLDERVVTGVSIFFIAYIILMCVSVLLVSLDGYGFETNFTAVLSCTVQHRSRPGAGRSDVQLRHLFQLGKAGVDVRHALRTAGDLPHAHFVHADRLAAQRGSSSLTRRIITS